MKTQLPDFFNYNEDKVDSGYESLHDFFLSWTLRCSQDDFSEINNLLHTYSKNILFELIYGKPDLNYGVTEITVKRQYGFIDLLVNVKIRLEDGTIEYYILNIENKWYTDVSQNQLNNYSIFINNEYRNSNYKVMNFVIFPDYENVNRNKLNIDKNGYQIKTYEDLKDIIGEQPTNNKLFDEFWFNFY